MLDDHQPNGPKKQPASKRSEKSEHQESPKKAKSGDNFLPLVGNILFYRNTVPTWECLPSGAPADSRSPNVTWRPPSAWSCDIELGSNARTRQRALLAKRN